MASLSLIGEGIPVAYSEVKLVERVKFGLKLPGDHRLPEVLPPSEQLDCSPVGILLDCLLYATEPPAWSEIFH